MQSLQLTHLNLFSEARESCTWLETVDSILDTITRRNAELFETYKHYKHKDQVVPKEASHLKILFTASASFQVLKIDEDSGEYKINRAEYKGNKVSHCINIINKHCTCGKWQDRAYPCIDAVAYYRLFENQSLENILANEVSQLYNCRSLYHLYKKNMKPVIISTLTMDGKTLPPGDTNKRRAGRPRKKRIRNRSKYEDADDSPIICSFCEQSGHNIRGCRDRIAIESGCRSIAHLQLDDAERAAARDPGYEHNLL